SGDRVPPGACVRSPAWRAPAGRVRGSFGRPRGGLLRGRGGGQAEDFEALIEAHVDGDARLLQAIEIGGELGPDDALLLRELHGTGVVAGGLEGQEEA